MVLSQSYCINELVTVDKLTIPTHHILPNPISNPNLDRTLSSNYIVYIALKLSVSAIIYPRWTATN